MALYARIQDGRVFEFFETEGDIDTMFANLVWVDVTDISGVQAGWVATEVDGVWSFAEYVPPPPTPEEILISQSAKLQSLTQLANAQKAALTNRVGTLNDAVELDMATSEEEAELPVRTAQLKAWKTYAVLLGRVTTQPGWPPEVVWPAQPAEGMDLSVSAVSGRASTASVS